jgi:glucokinase
VQFIRWFGGATAVLAVAFITAGGIYFAMTGMTRRQEQRQSRSSSEFRPQGRRQSLSDGMRELSVTTATVAIAAIIGRRVFRLRL